MCITCCSAFHAGKGDLCTAKHPLLDRKPWCPAVIYFFVLLSLSDCLVCGYCCYNKLLDFSLFLLLVQIIYKSRLLCFYFTENHNHRNATVKSVLGSAADLGQYINTLCWAHSLIRWVYTGRLKPKLEVFVARVAHHSHSKWQKGAQLKRSRRWTQPASCPPPARRHGGTQLKGSRRCP